MSSVSSRASSPMFHMTATGTEASTPASSPPPTVKESEEHIEIKDEGDEDTSERLRALSNLLEKSAAYVAILKQQMDKVKLSGGRRTVKSSTSNLAKPVSSAAKPANAKKRPYLSTQDATEHAAKRVKVEGSTQAVSVKEASARGVEDEKSFEQPPLITGATLRDYQLEGLAWMVGLYESGISGILADEMGLGKTLQTISFHAFLRERSPLPFLVVCPLSVLNNWAEEFEKFAPAIPVVMYHGTREERAEIRQTRMVFSEEDMRYQDRLLGRGGSSRQASPAVSTSKGRSKTLKGKTSMKSIKSHRDASGKVTRPQASSNQTPLPSHQRTNFPVVITTYEMLIRDRAYLTEYYWGFIVVDEGHRLKNMDCKLIREIKKLHATSRMVLTGTPLQNNLSELWALLNFVLPDLFSDVNAFEEWFNLPQLQATISTSRSAQIIHSLHSILRPFLLRRLKADVETNLPPKKEYVLYAPLSERQRELYDAIACGGLRALLMKEANLMKDRKSAAPILEVVEESDEEEEEPLAKGKGKRSGLRRTMRKSYALDGDDDVYFQKFESEELEDLRRRERQKNAEELGREWQHKTMMAKVNRMSLQNTVMQLRKVCSHPFLFDWPADPKTRLPVLNEELSAASGKMLVLERLLGELFKRGHKVLLFSQFTTMLDIIEDWASEFKGWPLCRIDGSTSMADRREEVDRFQKSGDATNAPRLFLLSTRAGGLGLNLVAADTVIFYDQDWNPQMDLQAQDRAHRIGQTKPVLVFRIVSKHTIETRIMQRATEKRKLEALVIAKGEFKNPTLATGRSRKESMAEMAAALLKLEGEQIEVVPNTAAGKASVISDEELNLLLDRSPEVFTERGKGWTSARRAQSDAAEGGAKKTAFAVYEAPVNDGGDFLAGMMADEEEVEDVAGSDD